MWDGKIYKYLYIRHILFVIYIFGLMHSSSKGLFYFLFDTISSDTITVNATQTDTFDTVTARDVAKAF